MQESVKKRNIWRPPPGEAALVPEKVRGIWTGS
jgi:hypothetical protein